MLIDRFGRRVTNLRIAVTMRCNLRCFYCHREGQSGEGEELSVEEIAEIARAFYDLGVKKVKITGGVLNAFLSGSIHDYKWNYAR